MNFSLDGLRIFIVVGRTGNLSAAAKALGMTQPQVGRQMANLEQEVDMPLFVRHSRGLALTKQGREFLSLCQHVVGQLAQGIRLIREKNSEPEGCLSLVSGTGMIDPILENIEAFSQKFPKISFRFSTVINIYQLINNVYQLQIGDADIAVIPETISDAHFNQRLLFNASERVYASPGYLQSHPVPKSLKGLQGHRVILYGDERQQIHNKQIMNEDTVSFLQPFITLRSGPTMRTALINGAGIGCYLYNRDIMAKGLLVDVFPDMPDNMRPYYYTYHKRLEGSPKAEAFYAFLKDAMKGWERP
ncbi:MAG: LysR family transcriptional regulator [Alphaproteobacteria bacterium]|jgi:DNA-binding transcriptional LysR family regulator|nr:LysR family transcriptional regulator [Alphaproteobacteria bacterium]